MPRHPLRPIARAGMVLASLAVLGSAGAQLVPRPVAAPDAQDVPYGPHPRQTLDFWLPRAAEGPAPGAEPRTAPLVVFYHGGGFLMGDKASIPRRLLRACLDAGFAVASVNYRLSRHAPYPAPMNDGARALQFLRAKGKDWRIDADRVALAGDSAGAGMALWIAYRDDLAEPSSDDPVARRSTRVSAVGTIGAQTSYDPRFIRRHIGGRADEHPALAPFFGLPPEDRDTPEAYALYESASPIRHATPDDPPTYLYHSEPKGPLPPDARPGQGIHHPAFGAVLKGRLDRLGVRCVARHATDPRERRDESPYDSALLEMVAFFREAFEREDTSRPSVSIASDRD